MTPNNLQEMLDDIDDPVQNFRDRDLAESIRDYPDKPYDVPPEFTMRWGDPDTENTRVEPHTIDELNATVASAPHMKKDRQKAFA